MVRMVTQITGGEGLEILLATEFLGRMVTLHLLVAQRISLLITRLGEEDV